MNERLRWWKFIGAVVICAPIACSEQILPQLLAQMASLDRDHRVSLRACGDGVDLVLTHDDHSSPENDEGTALASSASESAHVVHIMTGSTTTNQSPLLTVGNTRDEVLYISTTNASVWHTFVAPLPLAYSRPPPDEMSISRVESRTLLLI